MGEDEQSLLVALTVAMPVSIGIAWLILLSVFRRETLKRLVSASALIGLFPYAVLFAHALGQTMSPADFVSTIPTIMLVSLLVTPWILRTLFRSEAWAKVLFASVLTAQFCCALPMVAAIRCALRPNSVTSAEFLSVNTVLQDLIFVPGGLLVVLWLLSSVRHSRSGGRSYDVEAAFALIVGLINLVGVYEVTMMWNTVD